MSKSDANNFFEFCFSYSKCFFCFSLDLRRWGGTFRENGARPYWEGHERADVVKSRETFINYFLDNKQSYYTVNDNEDLPGWIKPEKKPGRILICK